MPGRLVSKAPVWLPVVLILTLGLVLRLYRLGSWPPIHVDEAITGNMARDPWALLLDPFSAHAGYHFANAAPLFYAPLLQVPAEGIWTMRLTSVVFGVLTILATYYLGKEMFDRRVGLIAAFLVSTSHVALAYSRIGLDNAQVPLWHVLTFLFLWRALRRGQLRDWALVGLLLGTGMYIYFSYRVALPVIALFSLVLVLQQRSIVRKHSQGILLAVMTFGVLLLPLGVRFAQSPHQFLSENTDVTLLSQPEAFKEGYGTDDIKDVVWQQSLKTYHWFTRGGDTATQYGYAGPAVDGLTRALLVLGLAVALWRVRDPRYVLLLSWFLITPVLGGVLTGAPPQSSRLLGVIPPLAMLAGVSAAMIGRLLARYLPAVLVGAALVLAGGFVAFASYDAYFNRYSEKDIYWSWTDPPATLARYVNDLGGARVYILTTELVHRDHPIIRFLTHGQQAEIVDIQGWWEPDFRFDQELGPARTVFVFLPENKALIPQLASQYPGELKEFRGRVMWGDEGELFTSYEVLPPLP